MFEVEALKIVLELAHENIIMDPEMGAEYDRQMRALGVVQAMYVKMKEGSGV